MKKSIYTLLATLMTTTLMASPCSNDCCSADTSIYADFLWWTSQGDQLDYGIVTEGTRVDGDPDVETLSEKWLVFDPDWNPGLRVGVEKEFSCANVCVFGEWTWYKTDDSQKTDLALPDTLGSILTFNSDFTGGAGVGSKAFETGLIKSDFYFQMNRLDIGFCKTCCLCDNFQLKPYAAFTYAHLKENLKLHAQFNNSQSSFFETEDYKTTTTYCGYGAKLGLAADWKVFNCFSLYTEGSLTGLWGKFDLNKKFTLSEGGTVNSIDFINTFRFDDWRGRLISQVQLGLRYDTCLCNQYPVMIQFGWEHQVLFDQTNWMVRGSQLATEGSKAAANLVLQGLVARVGVGF
jgi:Legionella pneumophila major outer membrane protein precursor